MHWLPPLTVWTGMDQTLLLRDIRRLGDKMYERYHELLGGDYGTMIEEDPEFKRLHEARRSLMNYLDVLIMLEEIQA